MFRYELIQIARRGRYFLIRGGYACLLAALVLGMHWSWSHAYEQGTVPPGHMSLFAEQVFVVFMVLQLLLALVLTPAYTAAAIADEKERRTLEFLLATDLRDGEIVLGKLAARVCNLLLVLLLGLPILGLLELLGGVEPVLVVSGFTVLGATVISLAALSILLSAYASRSRTAVIGTYLLMLVYVFSASLAFTLLVEVLPQEKGIADLPDWVLLATDPPVDVRAFAHMLNSGSILFLVYQLGEELAGGTELADALPPLVRDYSIFHVVLAVVCTGWAILRLRVLALRQLFKVEAVPASRVRRRHGRVGEWPLLWKELFTGRVSWRRSLGQFFVFVLALTTLALPAYVGLASINDTFWWRNEAGFVSDFVSQVAVVAACCALLGVLLRAAGGISGERDQQTFDCLLTTPHELRPILFAKWLGSILGSRGVWSWLFVLWIEGVLLGNSRQLLNLPMLFPIWLVFAAFYAALGLWFSVACRNSLRALMASLLAGAGVACGHWLLWIVYYPFILMTFDPPQSVARLTRLHFGLNPPMVLYAAIAPPAKLEEHVRGWVEFYLCGTPQVMLARAYSSDREIFRSARATAYELPWCLGLDLCLYLLGTLVLGRLTLARLTAQTGRLPPRRPEIETPRGGSESEITVLLQASPRRAFRRRLLIRGGLAAALLVLPLGVYWYLDWSVGLDLRRAVDEAAASDPRWQLGDIEADRAVLPKEQNGAEPVLAARRLMGAGGAWLKTIPDADGKTVDLTTVLQRVPRNERLDAHQRRLLQAELRPLSRALAEAKKLVDLPQGRFHIDWDPVVAATVLPHVDGARSVAVLLSHDAFERIESDDVPGALLSLRALLNAGRSLGDDPFLISMLVRANISNMSVTAWERLLAQAEPAGADLADAQKSLEAEAGAPRLWLGIRGARASFHADLDQLEHGLAFRRFARRLGLIQTELPGVAGLTRASSQQAHAADLRLFTRAVEVASLPPEQARPRWRELLKDAEKLPWLARNLNSMQWLQRVSDACSFNQALLRCAIAAIAAERFRRSEGRWPHGLDELVPVYLKAVPLDPYDGQPLRFRRTPGTIVIYALGADGKDNGGNLDKERDQPGSDVGFRLWDVKRRRQPASAPD